MKRIFSLTKKEFAHIFRDTRTLVAVIAMPLVLIVLFGYAFSNQIRNAPMGVLDMARNSQSISFINSMTSSHFFIVKKDLASQADLDDQFRRNQIKLALVIGRDFGNMAKAANTQKPQVQVVYDASDPNLALSLQGYVSGILAQWLVDSRFASSPAYTVEVQNMYNPELKSAFLFVPGLMAIILSLVAATLTAVSIAREIEDGHLELLLSTPVRPHEVIISKMVPYFFLSLLLTALVFISSKILFDLPITLNVAGTALIIVGFLILCLFLGFFVGITTKNKQAALLASLMGLLLPVIILSGFIFPIENMPPPMQVMAHIIPATWFVMGIKKTLYITANPADVMKEIGILFAYSAVFFVINLRKFQTHIK